jgi:FMN phosphatase YigB (HAD superfamily)
MKELVIFDLDGTLAESKSPLDAEIDIKDMLFIGDAIFPGKNDYPAKTAGVTCIKVRDPEETKRIIETILACAETG